MNIEAKSLLSLSLWKQLCGGDGEEVISVQTQCGRPPLPQRIGLYKWVKERKT